MSTLRFEPDLCRQCPTVDCLMRCQHIRLDLETAKAERLNILEGRDSRVLRDCLTCYACEEYCPYGNHPFYQIVDRQEELGIWPAPVPLVKQQIIMMAPKGRAVPEKLTGPIIDMCYFPMLTKSIRGELYEGVSTIVGSDIFCNIMWLHFAKNSVIRERLPRAIDTLWNFYLKESGQDTLICYHDECYGTFNQLAPAFGIEVPFKTVHLFEYLVGRLEALKDKIRPIGMKAAYQRPCSNRLSPQTQPLVDEIFRRVGVERAEREYDRENALCCGGVLQAMQRDAQVEDIQKRNLDDMQAAGANLCVFNCPFCLFTLGEAVANRGMMPILMSELCQYALGEKPMLKG